MPASRCHNCGSTQPDNRARSFDGGVTALFGVIMQYQSAVSRLVWRSWRFRCRANAEIGNSNGLKCSRAAVNWAVMVEIALSRRLERAGCTGRALPCRAGATFLYGLIASDPWTYACCISMAAIAWERHGYPRGRAARVDLDRRR